MARLGRPKPLTPLDATKTRTPGGGSWLLGGKNYEQHEVVHPLVDAGTGSGKTVSIGRPAMYDVLVNRPQHLVISDPKGEELRELLALAAVRNYYLYSFDPNTPKTSSLNPISSPTLADAFFGSLLIHPDVRDPFWQENAFRLAVAVAEAVGYTSLLDVYEALRSPKRLDALAQTNEELTINWSEQNENHRESFRTNVLGPLMPLRHPHIRQLFSPGAEENDFGPGQPSLIVIQTPLDDEVKQAWRPLISSTTAHFWRRSLDGYDLHGPATGPGTFWIMDETPVTLNLAALEKWITTGRGKGQRVMPIVQSLGQIDKQIGHDARRSLVGSCDLHIYGKTNDQESAEKIAEATGKVYRNRAVRQDAHRGRFTQLLNDARGETTTHVREVEETRIHADTIMGLPTGDFIFVSGSRAGTEIVTGTDIDTYKHILAERNIHPPEQARQLGIAPEPQQTPSRTHSATQSPAAPPEQPQPAPTPTAEPASDPNEAEETCRRLLTEAAGLMQTKHSLHVSFAPPVVDWLENRTSDPSQLPSLIESEITEKLRAYLADGRLDSGQAITINVREDGQLSSHLHPPESQSSPSSGEHPAQNTPPPDNGQREDNGQRQTEPTPRPQPASQPEPRSEPEPIPRPQQHSSRKTPTDWTPRQTCIECSRRFIATARACEHCGAWQSTQGRF